MALVAAAGSLAAQGYPRARAGEFEVRGFDIGADGGWRRATARVMLARQVALRGGAMAQLNSPILSVRGTFFLPVIPLSFANAPLPFPRLTYQRLFFEPVPVDRPYSVRSFYRAASRSSVVLDGTVFEPVRLDGTATYYEDGCNGVGIYAPCPVRSRPRMAELLLAALDSISRGPGSDTIWNRFDNDGPDGLPNSGDDDGVVDLVTFLQPRVDGACGTAGIWAHRYVMRGWNGGVPYATRTPRRSTTGQPIPGQYLMVDSYTMQSGRGGNSSCDEGQVMPIGTVAHETGHAFGLPDLYDTDRVAGNEGIGEWGLMSSGNYATAWSPSSFDAWSLVQLGWVAVDTVPSGRTIRASAVQQGDTVYHVATDIPGVSLLIENRQALASDTAMMNPSFARAKGPGLLIWRIDEGRIAGSLTSNTVNVGLRPGVALMQADGLDHLRATMGGPRNRGDAGDPWPGSSGRTSFGLASFPAATNWDNAPLGVRIDRIMALSGGQVAFRITRRAPVLLAARAAKARIIVNGMSVARWSEIVPAGDTIELGIDSIQVTPDQRTRSEFVRWTDGGSARRTLVVGAGRPDTLLAEFIVTHRVEVRATSGGTVTATLQGAVGPGVFAMDGAHTTNTAAAQSGFEFVRWRGDTNSRSPVLELTVSRPWSVTAEFASPVAVDATAAARAVLGGPRLSASVSAYLDDTGNRNGAYDLGDLLAWLRRTGQPIPAALARERRTGGM